MRYNHATHQCLQFYPSNVTQITSQDIQVWINRLTCISDRLEREIGLRRHRYGAFKHETSGDTALDWLIKTCMQTFNTSQVFVWLADREAGEISIDTFGSAYPHEPQFNREVSEGIIERAARDKESLILTRSDSPGLGVTMVVPISLGDWFIGVLMAGPSRVSTEYSFQDLETLEFIVEVTAVCCHLATQSKSEVRTLREVAASPARTTEEHQNAA